LHSLLSSGCTRTQCAVIAKVARTTEFETIVLPTTDTFNVAVAIVGSGVPPENIMASNTSFGSSLLGYYITDQDVRKLHIVTELDHVKDQGDPQYVASIMFAVKKAHLNPTNYYVSEILSDMTAHADQYIAKIHDHLTTLKEQLAGIKYAVMTPSEAVSGLCEKQETLIHISCYDTTDKVAEGISWTPQAHQETMSCEDMIAELAGRPATTIVSNMSLSDESPTGWTVFYAKKKKMDSTDHLLINNESCFLKTTRPHIPVLETHPYPVMPPDHEITPNSPITLLRVPVAVALYYRDLFVHRLGVTSGGETYLMIIDGMVCGVIGMASEFIDSKAYGYVHETFGITAHTTRYKSFARLLTLLCTCQEFADTCLSNRIWTYHGLVTTCFSRTPYVKANDGIMEITEKNKREDGLWKIRYETEFYQKTYKECLKEWLSIEYKSSEYTRNYGKPRRRQRVRTTK